MKYVSNWSTIKNTVTPTIKFKDIEEGCIPLPNEKYSHGFRSTPKGNAVKLDVDGDGQTEKNLKKKENLTEKQEK